MSRTAVPFASRLGDFVSAERIITDSGSLERYEIDGRRPSAALLPVSVQEIAEILRFAATERLATIPVGGGTHLHIGMPPQNYDLALDVSGIKRVLAYEPQDLTVSVEPGTTCADLAQALHEKSQFLPLSAPFANRATLGGMVAAAADTPLRYAHGTSKDFLLGLEFLSGEGIASKSGSRVVKNVTGYDIHKLFIGSLGTLGVITRLNFRTFPLPPARKCFVVAFSDGSRAFDLCRAIMKSPLQPRILDVLDPAARRIFSPRAAGFLTGEHWLVLAETAGVQAVLNRHERDLAAMAQEAQADEFTALDGDGEQLPALLSEFSQMAFKKTSAATLFRIAAVPACMARLTPEIAKLADCHGLDSAVLIRALAVIYVALLPRASSATSSELIACSRELMNLCLRSGAPAMIERCPLELKHALSVWPAPESESQLARRLKDVFDPQGILSPGRFRGGI